MSTKTPEEIAEAAKALGGRDVLEPMTRDTAVKAEGGGLLGSLDRTVRAYEHATESMKRTGWVAPQATADVAIMRELRQRLEACGNEHPAWEETTWREFTEWLRENLR